MVKSALGVFCGKWSVSYVKVAAQLLSTARTLLAGLARLTTCPFCYFTEDHSKTSCATNPKNSQDLWHNNRIVGSEDDSSDKPRPRGTCCKRRHWESTGPRPSPGDTGEQLKIVSIIFFSIHLLYKMSSSSSTHSVVALQTTHAPTDLISLSAEAHDMSVPFKQLWITNAKRFGYKLWQSQSPRSKSVLLFSVFFCFWWTKSIIPMVARGLLRWLMLCSVI